MPKMHRSFHFIPGSCPHYLETEFLSQPDYYILDLEDALGDDQKASARQKIVDYNSNIKESIRKKIFIRVNHKLSAFYNQDIELVKKIAPAGIVFPKVENTEDFETIFLNESNKTHLKTIILIESIKGLKNLDNIFENPVDTNNIFAVALGLEDLFANDFTIFKEKATALVKQIKTSAVISAKAHNVPCIDSISLEYMDIPAFEKICLESRNLGFNGMLTIHPNQTGPVNKYFSPLEHEVKWAHKICDALGKDNKNKGYQKSNGIIIGPPKIKLAKKIINIKNSVEHSRKYGE